MIAIISTVPKVKGDASRLMVDFYHILKKLGYQPIFWNADQSVSEPHEALPKIEIPLSLSKKLTTFSLKWAYRYAEWRNCDFCRAIKWAIRTHWLAEALWEKYHPKIFFCWNRSCCQFGYTAEIMEKKGAVVIDIEWGCLPSSILVTARDCTFPNWESPRIYSNRPPTFSLGNIAPVSTGIYAQNSKLYTEYKYLAEIESKIRVLYLGVCEVDAFCVPSFHQDRKRYLPFSRNGNHLFQQIASLMPNAVCAYKPHPQTRNCMPRQVSTNSYIVDGNPGDWIQWADVIVTNGSKMEVDAVFHGKKLICVGGGLFWGTEVASCVKSLPDLKNALEIAAAGNRETACSYSELLSVLSSIANTELLIEGRHIHNYHLVENLIYNYNCKTL